MHGQPFQTRPCHLSIPLAENLIFCHSLPRYTWIFTEDSGQGHDNAVERTEPKSVGFIIHQPKLRITYLQVQTVSESSIVTSEPSTIEVDGGTKFGFGGGVEVEVDGVEVEVYEVKKCKRLSPRS